MHAVGQNVTGYNERTRKNKKYKNDTQ